jgi:glycosyltransferase involved in cell wall biosynthesis
MSVAVLTATLPERSQLLSECKQSVEAQTVQVEHLIGLDSGREGPQTIRNRLAWASDAEWFLPLDDDDTLDPSCIQVLLENADADIIYPWCRMLGRTDGWVPNKLFSAQSLFQMNFIPCTALIRADVYRMLGGYQQVQLEDWQMWQRAWLHGCTFKCVAEVLWSYRHHEGQTFQREAA